MKRVLTNEFSWSKSRHEKLSECARAYYLHYYGSWGGWEADAPRKIRELYVLKKLDNRHTWAGGMVHGAIRRLLEDIRGGRAPEAGNAIDRARQTMREDYVFSKGRSYWRERRRKEFSGLVEHEYGEPVSQEEWRASFECVRGALEAFAASRWVSLAASLGPEQWLEVDQTDFERSTFRLEGVKVFAVPDFAFVDHDGTPVVVDWKTGKARDGYDDQVLGYSLYLSSRYAVPAEAVRTCLVYLNEGVERTVNVDAGALKGFRERFAKSVEQMRALLAEKAANVPAPEERFTLTEDRATCARCAFRRPCGRESAREPEREGPG